MTQLLYQVAAMEGTIARLAKVFEAYHHTSDEPHTNIVMKGPAQEHTGTAPSDVRVAAA